MPRVLAVICSAATLATVAATGASAAILHDQLDNFGSLNANSSDPPGAGNSTEVADDFLVPAGQIWGLDRVDVFGLPAGVTSTIDVSVFADAGGLPGASVDTRLSVIPGGTDPDWSVPLSPSIVLSAGTYWIAVQANTTGGSWGWRNRTVQSGSPAAIRSEFAIGTCPSDFTFRSKASCLGPSVDPDQAFRLSGTMRQIGDCAGAEATMTGTAAADAISGTAGPDVIDGGGGKDRIRGLGGNDRICGAAGNDTLIGGGGNDRLLGGAGRDVLRGGKGKDKLKGGPGRDVERQ